MQSLEHALNPFHIFFSITEWLECAVDETKFVMQDILGKLRLAGPRGPHHYLQSSSQASSSLILYYQELLSALNSMLSNDNQISVYQYAGYTEYYQNIPNKNSALAWPLDQPDRLVISCHPSCHNDSFLSPPKRVELPSTLYSLYALVYLPRPSFESNRCQRSSLMLLDQPSCCIVLVVPDFMSIGGMGGVHLYHCMRYCDSFAEINSARTSMKTGKMNQPPTYHVFTSYVLRSYWPTPLIFRATKSKLAIIK